jgi:hypothetical protein
VVMVFRFRDKSIVEVQSGHEPSLYHLAALVDGSRRRRQHPREALRNGEHNRGRKKEGTGNRRKQSDWWVKGRRANRKIFDFWHFITLAPNSNINQFGIQIEYLMLFGCVVPLLRNLSAPSLIPQCTWPRSRIRASIRAGG